jgi:hypothetical protein
MLLHGFFSTIGNSGGAPAVTAPAAVVDSSNVLLLFTIGQSNADGRASSTHLPIALQGDLADCYTWRQTLGDFEVLNGATNSSSQAGKFGPELKMSYDLKEYFRKRVYAVKYAVGGTMLYEQAGMDWNPNSVNEYLDLAIARYNAAYTKLTSMGKTVTPVVVWWQGETDAEDDARANAYHNNQVALRAKVETISALTGALWVVYKVFLYDPTRSGLVNTAKGNLKTAYPKTAVIEVEAYERNSPVDTIHAGYNGQLSAGSDGAAAIINAGIYN